MVSTLRSQTTRSTPRPSNYETKDQDKTTSTKAKTTGVVLRNLETKIRGQQADKKQTTLSM